MSEMARDWRKATAALPGAKPTPLPASQDQTRQFLRSQIQAFLDYRARTARSRRRRKAG
jgi:hypothetical protein